LAAKCMIRASWIHSILCVSWQHSWLGAAADISWKQNHSIWSKICLHFTSFCKEKINEL